MRQSATNVLSSDRARIARTKCTSRGLVPTTPAILFDPALARDRSWRSIAQRALSLAAGLAFAAAVVVGGTLLVAAAMMVAVVAAPLAAVIAFWVVWRPPPRATARRPRARRT
jgi:hypothetical protein